jgi:hypothetical protein
METAMPFNGSGIFNRLYSWVTDNNNGLDIRADRMDQDSNDIASGLSNCMTRDGQQTPTANLKMAGFRFTGLGAGVAAADSAQLGQVQAEGYQYAVATGTANAIAIAMTPTTTALNDGEIYRFRAAASNTGATTLAVDANTAAAMVLASGAALQGGEIQSNNTYEVVYSSRNGNFALINPSNSDVTSRWAVAGGTAQAITLSNAVPFTALYDGAIQNIRFSAANTATAPTFAPDGLTAHPITKLGGVALVPGDIQNLLEGAMRYNAANTRWELLDPGICPGADPWVFAGGTSDAITATYSPTVAALYDGLLCMFRATAANATTTPTFAPNGLTAHTITKQGGSVLGIGDIPGNLAECVLRYNLANTRWELLNPSVPAPPPAFRNKFRNSSMDVCSRGTSSITVTTAGAYVTDGWIVVPTGASCTAQKTTNNQRTGALSAGSLLMTGAASVTDVLVKQRIESMVAQALEGQTVTFQAQVYNNTGGSITPTLTVKHAGSADNWTSPVTDVNAQSLQACANAAWTQVSYTFTASTSAGNGLEITVDFGNNFGSTGKSVQITELDLSSTSSILVPELRPLPIEQVFCNRYFCSSYPNGTAPGTAGNNLSVGGPNVSGGSLGFTVFPVEMRAAPTISYWDGAGNASKNSYYTNAIARTDNVGALNVAPTNISTKGFMWDASTASSAQCGAIGWQASAEL